VDRHGGIILSGWDIGLAEKAAGNGRKGFVHQRVFAAVLEPPHLSENGRGMQAFAPRKFPERCAFFGMIKVVSQSGRLAAVNSGNSIVPFLSTPRLQ
jgi:hypothetical protein